MCVCVYTYKGSSKREKGRKKKRNKKVRKNETKRERMHVCLYEYVYMYVCVYESHEKRGKHVISSEKPKRKKGKTIGGSDDLRAAPW